MSRSGYSDEVEDQWALIRWRGAVASAIRGKRGQAFLREMRNAMDALPAKRLIADELEADGEVCAIGSVGKARGIDMSNIDPYDNSTIAAKFGISLALAKEIMWMNDDAFWEPSAEDRFRKMRAWIEKNLHD